MRRLILGLLVVAVLVTPLSAPRGGSASSGTNRVTLSCVFWQVYQRLQVDPILSPGVPQSAHSHDFYGRQDINDYMFAKAVWPPNPNHPTDPGYTPLPSSCNTYGDWAGYWFPSPEWNGTLISTAWNVPGGNLLETWQSPAGSTVAPPPWGMTSVVGNSRATSEATEGPHLRFTCGSLDGLGSNAPQDCTGVGPVTAELTFPDCFDGSGQLYFDYVPAGIASKHFAYSVAGTCPSAFPTQIAQLVTQQHFMDPRTGAQMVNPLNTDGTVGLSFASGPYYTYHGDYLDSWSTDTLTPIVNGCLNQLGNCPTVH